MRDYMRVILTTAATGERKEWLLCKRVYYPHIEVSLTHTANAFQHDMRDYMRVILTTAATGERKEAKEKSGRAYALSV